MTEKQGEWVWVRDSGESELTEFELAGFYCSVEYPEIADQSYCLRCQGRWTGIYILLYKFITLIRQFSVSYRYILWVLLYFGDPIRRTTGTKMSYKRFIIQRFSFPKTRKPERVLGCARSGGLGGLQLTCLTSSYGKNIQQYFPLNRAEYRRRGRRPSWLNFDISYIAWDYCFIIQLIVNKSQNKSIEMYQRTKDICWYCLA